MAKDKKGVSPRTSVDTLNETLTSAEQKVEKNKKIIVIVVVSVVAIAAAILGIYYGYVKPRNEAATEKIGKADEAKMKNDSISKAKALATYMEVADEYGSTDSGNRAKLESAALLYEQGKYEDALKYIDDYDIEENFVGPASQSLKGDCYVNLKKYDEAIEAYDKAIKESDENDLYTPFFMLKKATVLKEQKEFKKAVEVYQDIKTLYPKYEGAYGISIDKYLEEAKALGGIK